jgi:hypothetical protein
MTKRDYTENANSICSACANAGTRLQEAIPDYERIDRDDLEKLSQMKPPDPKDYARQRDAVADPRAEIAAIQQRLGDAVKYLDRAETLIKQHRAEIARLRDKKF